MTYYRVVSITEDAAIDRLKHTLQRLAHFTHTTELKGLTLPFRWTNSVPAKLSYHHDTLPATPTHSLSGLSYGWPHAYQRHIRPPSWQNGPKRGHELKTKHGHTRLMPSYLIRVASAHNLPSLEAPARGTTKDRIKTFP